MCGGIGFKISEIPERELKKRFAQEEIEKLKRDGEVRLFFWSKEPILPIKIDNEVKLIDWGNRDKQIKLPLTGWVKQESLNEGKWNYLKPKEVKILANRGCEKKVWFDIPSGGLTGIMVESKNPDGKMDKRVYMITKPADKDYLKLTNHNRQPIEYNTI